MNTDVFLSIFSVFLDFFRDLKFSVSFTSLVSSLKKLYVLDAIVNGSVSMISLSVCLLVASRKATDFWKLTLYPATLLKLIFFVFFFFKKFSGELFGIF